MAARKPISKKLRFEVFKRDAFKCQYCGKSSPDVVLEVDHINPVANGGKNDIINLVTACYDCNHGKSARLLNENTMLEKQRRQLEELNERREQLKLMTQWKQELLALEMEQVSIIENLLSDATNYSFSDHGRKKCLNVIKKCGLECVYDATQAAISQYLKKDKNGELIKESVDKTFTMYQRIAIATKNGTIDDDKKQLYYIRGIVRNRMYCNEYKAMEYLTAAYNAGASLDDLKQEAITARNWTEWVSTMQEYAGDE